MQEPEVLEVLRTSTEEVLETMFFSYVLGDNSEAGAAPEEESPATPSVSSRLSFRGAPSGVFEVSLSLPAAQSLAAGFLGEDEPELSPKQIGDVVCELANMLCGSILSHFSSASVFDLSHPALTPRLDAAPATRRCFEIPDGMLTVSLRFEEAA